MSSKPASPASSPKRPRTDDETAAAAPATKKQRTDAGDATPPPETTTTAPSRCALRAVPFDPARTWWHFFCVDRRRTTCQWLLDPASCTVEQRDAMVELIHEEPSLFVAIGEAMRGQLDETRTDWDDVHAKEVLVGDWAWAPWDQDADGEGTQDETAAVHVGRFIHVMYDGYFC